MVYYRKYRPQTIEELDSTKVRETLTAVLSAPSVPHAFLFTGPKGLGKTSTARIIAKIVNCTGRDKGIGESVKGKDKEESKKLNASRLTLNANIDPCNTCDSCVSITNGSNIDVLEIDGASNRGIDEIRDLREKVKLAPSSAKKKVYIIDEVHMLTTEAFNALLKTIEEPPDHVMFMFATTEPQKVPATILSRCFHVAFPRATNEDIVHSLERIVKGETLDVDADALVEIAKMADGGFRDAAKMLEEVVAITAANNTKITRDLVAEFFGGANAQQLLKAYLGHLKLKETKQAIGIINDLISQGTDIKYAISQILNLLHERLLAEFETDLLIKQEITFSLEEIRILTDALGDVYQKTKYSPIPQLPLEVLTIEWCQQKKQENVILNDSEGSQAISNGGYSGQARMTIGKRDSSAAPQGKEDGSRIKSGMTGRGPTIDETRKKEQTLKVRSILDGKKEETLRQAQGKKVVVGVSQNPIPHNVDAMTQLMENIIYKVKPLNHSLAGVLRGCDIATYDDVSLIIETAYKFHKERLDDGKAKDIIQQAIKEITGKQIQVLIELKNQ